MSPVVHVVGGGLAGTEAAWQCLRRGLRVVLHEMRPIKTTAAHQTGDLAELVCSNSLKSVDPGSAPGLLKSEMKWFDSIILQAASEASVPAGMALAVDRKKFSEAITERLQACPLFSRDYSEILRLPSIEEALSRNEYWIVATGPLTSNALVEDLERYLGGISRLYFYDAIAPVLDAESIDESVIFRQDRYGEPNNGDYLNVPLSRDQYEKFIDDVLAAEKMALHDFEEPKFFESCLPIEVMVARGRETLRFGPMKPVGLIDPKTGRQPWAAVQLRQENKECSMVSMVGFQTKMKWPEQQRVFRTLPGLEQAEFFRLGSVHRNTYVQGPKVLSGDLRLKTHGRVWLAGQITGVEGYTESASIGLLAGRIVASEALGELPFALPPKNCMIGALLNYVTEGSLGPFQPMNANLGLLPSIAKQRGVSKVDRKAVQCNRANEVFLSTYSSSAFKGSSLGD